MVVVEKEVDGLEYLGSSLWRHISMKPNSHEASNSSSPEAHFMTVLETGSLTKVKCDHTGEVLIQSFSRREGNAKSGCP